MEESHIKNGKAPTRKQKGRLKKLGLNPDDYLITKDCSECFEIVHRFTDKVRRVEVTHENH